MTIKVRYPDGTVRHIKGQLPKRARIKMIDLGLLEPEDAQLIMDIIEELDAIEAARNNE